MKKDINLIDNNTAARDAQVHELRKQHLHEQLAKDAQGLVIFPSEETGFSTIVHTVGLNQKIGFDVIAVTWPVEIAEEIYEIANMLFTKNLKFPLTMPVVIQNYKSKPVMVFQLSPNVVDKFAKNIAVHSRLHKYADRAVVLQVISGVYDLDKKMFTFDVCGFQNLITRPMQNVNDQQVYFDEV